VAKGERHGDCLGVSVNRQAMGGYAELIEVVADVEVVEQQIDQPARPGQAARLIEERPKDRWTAVTSRGAEVGLVEQWADAEFPQRWASSEVIPHGAHLQSGRRSWERTSKCAPWWSRTAGRVGSEAAPLADLSEEKGYAGMYPHSVTGRSVHRRQEALGGLVEREPCVRPGRALAESCQPLHVAPDRPVRLMLVRHLYASSACLRDRSSRCTTRLEHRVTCRTELQSDGPPRAWARRRWMVRRVDVHAGEER